MEAKRDIKLDFADYRDTLTSANLAQFLAAHDWTVQQDLGFRQVWTHASEGDLRPFIVQVPRDAKLIDYERRLREAISGMSDFYGWSLPALAEAVAAVRADLFFLRIDQGSSDGTIPLRQASILLEGIDSMVRSAALVAHSPRSTGRSARMPEYVKKFLQDDVRMGHTKRGSFIITVAARLDGASATRVDAGEVPSGRDSSVTQADVPAGDAVIAAPPLQQATYTRRVMTTLAQGIEATRDVANSGAGGDLEKAVNQGMRLPLVRAFREIGQSEGLRGVDVNFEWSTVEPLQVEVPELVSMSRTALSALESIEVRLSQRVEPRLETLIGPVIELKLADAAAADLPEEMSGEVVMRAEIDGSLKRVTVPLVGEDYDWAIRAHRARLPFTVTGTAEKKGRSWSMTGNVAVDTSFLAYQLGQGAQGAVDRADDAPSVRPLALPKNLEAIPPSEG